MKFKSFLEFVSGFFILFLSVKGALALDINVTSPVEDGSYDQDSVSLNWSISDSPNYCVVSFNGDINDSSICPYVFEDNFDDINFNVSAWHNYSSGLGYSIEENGIFNLSAQSAEAFAHLQVNFSTRYFGFYNSFFSVADSSNIRVGFLNESNITCSTRDCWTEWDICNFVISELTPNPFANPGRASFKYNESGSFCFKNSTADSWLCSGDNVVCNSVRNVSESFYPYIHLGSASASIFLTVDDFSLGVNVSDIDISLGEGSHSLVIYANESSDTIFTKTVNFSISSTPIGGGGEGGGGGGDSALDNLINTGQTFLECSTKTENLVLAANQASATLTFENLGILVQSFIDFFLCNGKGAFVRLSLI